MSNQPKEHNPDGLGFSGSCPVHPVTGEDEAPSEPEQPAAYDMSIHMNPDARAWARFFMETKATTPSIAEDEECMVGWFANAMMAMYDHVRAKTPAFDERDALRAEANAELEAAKKQLAEARKELHYASAYMEKAIAILGEPK